MMPEVRERYDQLRNGKIPQGYKQTAVGIVPQDWTEYSLGEVYTERKQAGDPSLPVLSVSIHTGVSDGELDEEMLGKKVKRIEDKTQYRTALEGDLVFNMMRAWQGAIGVVRGRGLVSPAYIVAKPSDQVYPPFMEYYMKTPRMINLIQCMSYGVTDFRLRLYWDSFGQIPCALPSLQEQKRIVEILKAQDAIIELGQQKIEQVKLMKKALINKMYPEIECSFPEIRFPGFTDPWEQRKLGECFSERSERKQTEGVELLSVTIAEGVIRQADSDKRNTASADTSNYKMVYPSDIAYNSMRMWQGAEGASDFYGIVSPAYTVISPYPDIDSCFFAYMFKRDDMLKTFERYSQGLTSDTWNLKFPALSKIHVSVPSIEEQSRISKFLAYLDKAITFHQRELEEERRKKKALMQLLLTGLVRVNA